MIEKLLIAIVAIYVINLILIYKNHRLNKKSYDLNAKMIWKNLDRLEYIQRKDDQADFLQEAEEARKREIARKQIEERMMKISKQKNKNNERKENKIRNRVHRKNGRDGERNQGE